MNHTKALPLPLYPGQQEIDTLKHRIRDLIPGADKFDDTVLTAFAQISLAHDLDPFIGEVWIIPTKRGPRIRAGIEGHRKLAQEQGHYQLDQRPMTDDERTLHALRENQIGAITELYRLDTQRPGVPILPFLGYGIYTTGERVAATKTPFWVALKRSEQDALRKAFSIPFANGARTSKDSNGDLRITPYPEVTPRHRAAIEWGYSQGPFTSKTHAYNAHAKLCRLNPEATPDDLDSLWTADVSGRLGDIAAASTAETTEHIPPHPPALPAPPPDYDEADIIDAATPAFTDNPPLDQWGRFRTPEAAVTWGIREGAFDGIDMARAAYDTLRSSAKPTTPAQMATLWTELVAYRLLLATQQEPPAA